MEGNEEKRLRKQMEMNLEWYLNNPKEWTWPTKLIGEWNNGNWHDNSIGIT